MNTTAATSPLVSVIVTTKDNESTIKACLDSIQEQSYANIETILVDNNSTDSTISIARGYKCKIFIKGPERSAQRNFGASKSTGNLLLFIDSDMVLTQNVLSEGVEFFLQRPPVMSLFIPEETAADGFWGQCKKFERDFYLAGDLSTEAVRFFRKEFFIRIGGYDEKQTGTEDWDLSDRAIAQNEYGRICSHIIHNEGYIELWEQLKKKRYYSKKGVSYYMSSAPKYRKYIYPFKPSVLKQWYLFLKSPFYGIGSIILKTLESVSMFF